MEDFSYKKFAVLFAVLFIVGFAIWSAVEQSQGTGATPRGGDQATVYVSSGENADDQNSGLMEDNPVRTLRRAFNIAEELPNSDAEVAVMGTQYSIPGSDIYPPIILNEGKNISWVSNQGDVVLTPSEASIEKLAFNIQDETNFSMKRLTLSNQPLTMNSDSSSVYLIENKFNAQQTQNATYVRVRADNQVAIADNEFVLSNRGGRELLEVNTPDIGNSQGGARVHGNHFTLPNINSEIAGSSPRAIGILVNPGVKPVHIVKNHFTTNDPQNESGHSMRTIGVRVDRDTSVPGPESASSPNVVIAENKFADFLGEQITINNESPWDSNLMDIDLRQNGLTEEATQK